MENGGNPNAVPPDSPSGMDSGESLRPDYREILRHPIRFLEIASPFLTSHHPACSEFSLHTFEFKGRYWCIGCFFNTLSFVASIAVLLFLWVTPIVSFNRFFLFWGGVAGVLIYLLVSVAHLTETTRSKILSKFVLGSSFAAVVWSLLLANGLLSMINAKFTLIFLLYLLVVAALSIKRVLETTETCERCEYNMEWRTCPGFRPIVSELLKEGFLVPE